MSYIYRVLRVHKEYDSSFTKFVWYITKDFTVELINVFIGKLTLSVTLVNLK